MRFALVSLATLGCETTLTTVDTGTTAPAPEPQAFAACFVAPSDAYLDEAAFTGTVVEAGAGGAPIDCFGYGNNAPLQTVSVRPSTGAWARVVDDLGAEWTLAWLVADPPAPLAVDAVVDVRVALSFIDYGGVSVSLVEATAADGLYASFAREPSVGDLVPPAGFTVEEGAESAVSVEACGKVSHSDLVVNGEAVPYGARATVDGSEVLHGGVDRSFLDYGCPDWYVQQAAVALIGG